MNNKLTITSRIMAAFGSGALVAVFFLPAWRIDLFAPQYPEGLTMNIWINGLTGDVDIINGLNHYIGMKHITVAMFPEFVYLPYVVGFFMLLGMVVAISGNRKILFAYICLTVIGGALAMYDFYQWGYDYGHNLDSTAPIQVPGLSYQPPLFGHKRLLNFDAYSFPHVGGWIVIAASGLMVAVWLIEKLRLRKLKNEPFSKLALSSLLLIILFSSCSSQPEPFHYGQDLCHTCKMGIIDPKFGGELITTKGKLYKFDDLNCMALFIRSGKVPQNQIDKIVVINYEKEQDFMDVQKSYFLLSSALKSPMGGNTAAFASQEAAQKLNTDINGKIVRWKDFCEQVP
jgi:copper chaperone NosL